MNEIGVSFEGLCDLEKLSQKYGTTNAFVSVALQWAGNANEEIKRLRAENAELRAENAEAKMIIRWVLEWVDAVPSDTQLPTMPGFDRDYVENFLSGEA